MLTICLYITIANKSIHFDKIICRFLLLLLLAKYKHVFRNDDDNDGRKQKKTLYSFNDSVVVRLRVIRDFKAQMPTTFILIRNSLRGKCKRHGNFFLYSLLHSAVVKEFFAQEVNENINAVQQRRSKKNVAAAATATTATTTQKTPQQNDKICVGCKYCWLFDIVIFLVKLKWHANENEESKVTWTPNKILAPDFNRHIAVKYMARVE